MSGPWRVARGLGLAAVAAILLAAAHATIIEPFHLTVTRVEIPPGPLAEALGGATVVHLSDLHFKGMGPRELDLLDELAALDPGLILMTGDYADTPEGIEALREVLGRLRPALGIFAVPGNNEYFRGRQQEIFAALREGGATLLVNEATTLRGPGGAIAVAGVDDPFFGRDDLDRALAHLPAGVPAILLAHSPSILLPRSDAILFNAGDADGPWGKGAFWTDGSHFRDPAPPVLFPGDGPRRVRIQVREDGVGIEALRLVPAGPAGSFSPVPRGLQGTGRRPPVEREGSVEIDLCAAEITNEGEGWRLERLAGGGCRLRFAGDEGRLESFPLGDPPDRAEIAFQAPGGVPFRAWALVRSPDGSGLSDSLYIQFDTAVDASGEPAFRAGSERPGAGGPPVELLLAGHTHGGQVRIPLFGPVERDLIPGGFVSGVYDVRGTMVYVSRGIGTSILPIRFACAPEIVVLGRAVERQDS